MSADNGIYILQSPTESGSLEYRIAHLQAIENHSFYGENGEKELCAYELLRWGNSKCYKSKSQALNNAHDLAETKPILVYGVKIIKSPIQFNKFNLTKQEAQEIINSFWRT